MSACAYPNHAIGMSSLKTVARGNVYSAASRCDTLAMAILQTSLLRHQPERESEVSL